VFAGEEAQFELHLRTAAFDRFALWIDVDTAKDPRHAVDVAGRRPSTPP
jgi:Mg-chelatase subunit ChlI